MADKYFVYLLIHQTEPRFKLGVAVDVVNRISKLPDKINRAESLMAECIDKAHAFRVKKTLHFLFRDSHVIDLPQCDGYTEWFKIGALNEVQAFCKRESVKLGLVTDFSSIPLREPSLSGVKPIYSYRPRSDVECGELGDVFALLWVWVHSLISECQRCNTFFGVYEEANALRDIVIVTVKDEAFFDNEIFLGGRFFKSVSSVAIDSESTQFLYFCRLGYGFSDAEPGHSLSCFADLVAVMRELQRFLMNEVDAEFFRAMKLEEIMPKANDYVEWLAKEIKSVVDDDRPSIPHAEVLEEWEKEKARLLEGIDVGHKSDA